MACKKYRLLTGLLFLVVSCSYAQVSNSSYDLRDSSLIPAKRIPQHNEWLNNAYPFPAQPRSQWEIGGKVGWSAVSSSVRYWGPTGGAGIHVRKALGYVFSIRAEYDYLTSKGLNWLPSSFATAHIPNISAYYPSPEPYFFNYKTRIHELSIQAVASLNNIRFHRAKSWWNAYAFAGLAGMTYSTFYNALDGSGNPYNFQPVINQFGGLGGFTYSNRKDIRKAIKGMLDGSWETMADRDNTQPKIGGAPFAVALVIGGGASFKLTEKFNIAVEDKLSLPKTNLIGGLRWQESAAPSLVSHYNTYNFLSVGLNYNIGKRAVEPLWWINPLDYAYGEINAPRHMKLPKPVLDDSDGDGVTDQFDLEPNTPRGCPVDTHGVSLDTDGDGVPDCRDKEKITPTICQPVDADGVGKCPDPACCKDIKAMIDSGLVGGGAGRRCSIGDLPSVTFKGRSVTLSKENMALLASAAQKMRDNPNCKVAVIGYGESSKSAQQLSWDRVNEVIRYLVEKEGISSDRFIFRYGQSGGEENTIDLKDATGEEGPNTVPAPHPNLRRR